MPDEYGRKLYHEYFYKRLTDIDEEERKLISAMRTKTGLIVLCDKLRSLEIEKQAIISVYEDMKYFF